MTTDPTAGEHADPAAAIPEPSDGEAVPPADERTTPAPEGDGQPHRAALAVTEDGSGTDPDEGGAPGAEGATVDVEGGAGLGSPDDATGGGTVRAPDEPSGAAPVVDPPDAGGGTPPGDADVAGGAGIGDPTDAAGGPSHEGSDAPTPATAEAAPTTGVEPSTEAASSEDAASSEAAVGTGSEATDTAPDTSGPVTTEVIASTEATASTEAPAGTDGAAAAPAGTAEEPPSGAPHPVPGVPTATAAGTLPPPPPELAEVPTDAGRIVTGRVREVSGDDVIVDLDDGRVGVINRRNLGLDGEPSAVLSPGDPVEGAVLARSDPQHRVVLSRTWALKKRAWEAIATAAAEGTVLTGRVVSVGQKGVVVDVGVRGFVPASHLEIGPVSDLQGYAGQELSLRVLDVDTDRERLVLSRRSLLLKEQRRSLHDVLSALQPGEVRRGKVASLSDYGAFIDLGGVNGLVHLSELSWQRVRHPSEVVNVGDEVDVKVLDVKVKKRRVSLSIRQLTDDPLGSLVPGEIRSGPVTRLVDFGAFVDLSGIEGLVHLSELAEYRVSAPEEIVAPGEQVRVKVLSVDRRRRRVELSIRQAAEYGG